MYGRCRRRKHMSQGEAVFIFGSMGLGIVLFVIAKLVCFCWEWACWMTEV